MKRQEGQQGQQGLFLLGHACPSRRYRRSCPYSRRFLLPSSPEEGCAGRPELSHARPNDGNREAELRESFRVASGDLLDSVLADSKFCIMAPLIRALPIRCD